MGRALQSADLRRRTPGEGVTFFFLDPFDPPFFWGAEEMERLERVAYEPFQEQNPLPSALGLPPPMPIPSSGEG
eukprot:scaffold35606_cov56-Isochrysis_galbana.AAC.1